VLDYESRFKDSVMEEFADSYIRGETPIPCVRCNQEVKFKDLLDTARDLGADVMATGHYVRQRVEDGQVTLERAVDQGRDQSYFLFATTQEQLDFIRFPLGGMEKDEVRKLAAKYGLEVAAKPDSQDICFVPDGSYVSVIERLRPGASEPGEIVDLDGRVLGRHKGIIHYTIGQRRGIGIGGGDPLYVIKLDPDNARVIVGPREALEITRLELREVNWLGSGEIPQGGIEVMAKVRSTRPPVKARLYPVRDGAARIDLLVPEKGVSAGQACVFYDGERVLGGGWIMRALADWEQDAA
jgi:tRNA-specific 2-thiouridylase